MVKFKCTIATITNGDACAHSELHDHPSDKMPSR
jgi:hypothetical protein